ncbi:TPA: Vir protein, partial [Legionella pneumophila]|nr:Vir protein [Legionella pneumophila]
MHYRRSTMQSIQKILVNVTPQKTCSAHPVMSKSEG